MLIYEINSVYFYIFTASTDHNYIFDIIFPDMHL